jgi:curved DNA-binding protein
LKEQAGKKEMEYKDYYKILGVDKNASKEEIKKAYRTLARRLHPDINPADREATVRFAEINEANEVLGDDAKRRKYDALGDDWRNYQDQGQPGGFDWSKYGTGGHADDYAGGDLNDVFGAEAFSDFFRSVFGMAGEGGRQGGKKISIQGADYYAELPLTLEEASATCVKTINLNGQNLRLTLEPGLKDNQTIKLKGKGGRGVNGGENGDLFLTIKIRLHPVYKREGDDLFMDLPVSFYKAVLGGEQTIKLLACTIKITIKPETKNGTVLRVPGKGFPVYGHRGKYGDLYIKLTVETPQGLSGREKELVAELARLRGEK